MQFFLPHLSFVKKERKEKEKKESNSLSPPSLSTLYPLSSSLVFFLSLSSLKLFLLISLKQNSSHIRKKKTSIEVICFCFPSIEVIYIVC